MKAAETGPESVEVGSISTEIFLGSVDLANVLQLSDSEVAKLARSRILARRRDPRDRRSFLYPCWTNVRNYIGHCRGPRETARTKFLEGREPSGELTPIRKNEGVVFYRRDELLRALGLV